MGLVNAIVQIGSQQIMELQSKDEKFMDNFYLVESHQFSIIRRVSTVLRNFSCIPPCEKDFATNSAVIKLLIQFLNIEEDEIVRNAIETVYNMAPHLTANDVSRTMPAVLKYLQHGDAEEVGLAAEILLHYSVSTHLEPDFLLRYKTELIPELINLLVTEDENTRLALLQILYTLSSFNHKTLSQNQQLMSFLFKFILLAANQSNEELGKRSALLLHNLSKNPNNLPLIRLHESSLVYAAAQFGQSTAAPILLNIVANTTNPKESLK